jgi:hypothetical protein
VATGSSHDVNVVALQWYMRIMRWQVIDSAVGSISIRSSRFSLLARIALDVLVFIWKNDLSISYRVGTIGKVKQMTHNPFHRLLRQTYGAQ